MTPVEVAPARGVVDTNVIILMEHIDATQLPEEIVLTTITMAELAAGPHYTDDPVERAARIERIHVAEALFETLPFDGRAARRYGQITAAVLGAGRNPRPRRVDLLIAAIASVNRLPLYTVNPKDFTGLEALVSVFPVTHPG